METGKYLFGSFHNKHLITDIRVNFEMIILFGQKETEGLFSDPPKLAESVWTIEPIFICLTPNGIRQRFQEKCK